MNLHNILVRNFWPDLIPEPARWVEPIFFPQTPGDNIFFSDIQCKIVFSGWITSHEIHFFQCRKFFSSGISLQYFFSLSKSVQRVLIYF